MIRPVEAVSVILGDGSTFALLGVGSTNNINAIKGANSSAFENEIDQAIYNNALASIGVWGTSGSSTTNGTGIGLSGLALGRNNVNVGTTGIALNDETSVTNTVITGLHGGVVTYSSPGIYNSIIGEVLADETVDANLVRENSALLLDTRGSNFPLIIARTNNGTTVFKVAASGAVTAPTYTLSGTTNQITFGATNTAPVVTTNAAKWISIQVAGFTNAYRLPIYE